VFGKILSCIERVIDLTFWKTWLLAHFAADIQNELINLLEARVWQTIISSIEKANCYSSLFVIVPDSLHKEQL
jgi:hypothetical protein